MEEEKPRGQVERWGGGWEVGAKVNFEPFITQALDNLLGASMGILDA